MPLETFHPIVAQWFTDRFGEPTEPQKLGWPSIARNENTLIAAPTGSGKTLSAFLVCIDRLVRLSIGGELRDECKILYLSPLKALASDIRTNLEIPLAEIQERVLRAGYPLFKPIRSAVRTGDTPSHERQAMVRKPPHILVTTPESLYLMLTSEKGRDALATVETVIVDEIHALARDKRGSHLALSLERLKARAEARPTMIGLSATQRPMDQIAHFLVGVGSPCHIVDVGHSRKLDLGVVVPESPLETVASHEQWDEIYKLLAEEIGKHRSTLIFVNTRRLAERVAFRLSEMVGEDLVLCHHGSLSKNRRQTAEQRLKEGSLKAIVATASLELGIDIGFIDLVVNIGIPYSIATFLQRIGRSGHAIKATPKGRLVPLTRDELLEALALLRAVRLGQLDRIHIPEEPVDILTQHLIAEVAAREMAVTTAHELFKGAWPYRNLTIEKFREVVTMAADGFAPGKRKFAYLIWDRIGDRLSVRAGARLSALTSGGAIPETGDYRVVLEDDGTVVGSVNEDFAIESMAGDIFLLGTHSWRIRHVRGGEVVVKDAQGQPPTIPFWEGEAPGRTQEFSIAVADLRREIGDRDDEEGARRWLVDQVGMNLEFPIAQAVEYVLVQKAALGVIPSRDKIVFERFFDEVGGMQLVIHSPYGARLNRAWGLALRKRFCRQFDFELQASADDDGIVLSIGAQQSFPIESLFKMLNAENIEHFLTQALLAAPMFGARWRWNATRALAVLRQVGGKRVVPAIQRFRSEDLLTAVFPAQTACQENAPGDIEVPDHPLVKQTVHDCLTEAMDIEGIRTLFREIEKGTVELIAKDTREPSPFAYQLLNAYPYAFLDEAALENRRTRTVSTRPALSAAELKDLDRMDPEAIFRVTDEAWPTPATSNELYEVLVATPAFPLALTEEWKSLVDALVEEKRVAVASGKFLVAAECVGLVTNAYDGIAWSQELKLPDFLPPPPDRTEARKAILRGWLDIRGPVSTEELGRIFELENPVTYLEAIEATGAILRCRLEGGDAEYRHWCSRGLLRRIHRLTIEGLREQIKPVTAADFFEFLFESHHMNLALEHPAGGPEGLLEILKRLEGFEAPALSWESELFPGRLVDYRQSHLDLLTSNGLVAFGRLTEKHTEGTPGRRQRLTSTMPLAFALRKDWAWIAVGKLVASLDALSSNTRLVWDALKGGGPQFIDELQENTGLLETQVEGALGELASEGLATSDHFHALRSILSPPKWISRKALRGSLGGRWSVLKKHELDTTKAEARVEHWAMLLLARYGIVFRDVLERESLAPSWGELVRVYRRMEARGEIRGGRFITGVSGEQYGLSETHDKLMRVREERAQGKRKSSYTVLSSADPLNLVGIVTKGQKIAASPSTRILFEAGEVTGIARGDEIEKLRDLDETRLAALRLSGGFRASATPRAS